MTYTNCSCLRLSHADSSLHCTCAYKLTVRGLLILCVSPHTELPPAAPTDLRVDGVDDTSVTVSWGAVSDADRYTVTFRQASGADQQGLCIGAHRVSVNATSTSASIGVGQMLAADDTTMLRAYTTYSITVVAVSNLTGSGEDSEAITVTTAQTSEWY